MHPADIERETRNFLVSNFLNGSSEELSDRDPLLGKVIDSTGVLELIGFLERQFSISVPDEDVIPENLDSIQNITAYVAKRVPNNLG
jgi:acyl carrier protein